MNEIVGNYSLNSKIMLNVIVKEKMDAAVFTLVTAKGNARDCIWQSYLQFQPLRETDFPNELKTKWNVLQNKLSADNNEATKVQYWLNKLSLDECIEIAELINDLDAEINVKYE